MKLSKLEALLESKSDRVTIELDWADEDDNTERKILASLKHAMNDFQIPNAEFSVKTMRGPGGGWPVVRITADKKKLADWLDALGYDDGIETYMVK